MVLKMLLSYIAIEKGEPTVTGRSSQRSDLYGPLFTDGGDPVRLLPALLGHYPSVVL